MIHRSRGVGLSIVLLFVACLVVACSSSTPASVPAASVLTSISPSQKPISTNGPTQTSISQNRDDWPAYHRDLTRSGFDPATPIVGSPRRLWTSANLDGDIYAEPLIVGGKILAATEQNSVYAFNISSGQLSWQINLGPPVPRSELSCGNIDPSGITSTPVADPASGRIFVCARVQPNHHEVFVLDIETGAILSNRTVDPPGSDPKVQQQRAALTLAGDKIYVAFGGLYGDCGLYYGWIVGVPVTGNGPLLSYRVSANRGAGVWAPSGPAVGPEGDLYVTSGNSFSSSKFDFSSSVVRLSPTLSLVDWFAPANWKELDAGDVDLGSMGPALIQEGLVFQAGKEGRGYLLKQDQLGQIGGEVFSDSIGGGAYGGTAYAPPYLYVPRTNGLAALLVDSRPSFKTVWTGPNFDAGPPAVAGSTVLSIDLSSGFLYGFAADTGRVLFNLKVGPVMHFTSPALSAGKIILAAGRQIICLGP